MTSANNPRDLAQRQLVSFNPALTVQGLAAALCLLGFSSMSGAPWMAYLAAAVAVYALYAGAPFWRLVSVPACLRLARYTPYAAAFAGTSVAAAFLANAPYTPLAVAGSLMIIAALALFGATCVLLVTRALRILLFQVRRASCAGIDGLRLYARLFWL